MKDNVRCERCNEKLNPNKVVWLEFSMTDGNYYKPENFPTNHESQGGFTFGLSCSKTQLKETEKNLNG